MSREVGRRPDKSYGQEKNMTRIYSQKQIKIKKVKFKSITNQHSSLKTRKHVCNNIEKSLIDLSFSRYNLQKNP